MQVTSLQKNAAAISPMERSTILMMRKEELRECHNISERIRAQGVTMIDYFLPRIRNIERMLFELKSRYFDALIRHHGAVADIERLIGEPINSTREDSGRP